MICKECRTGAHVVCPGGTFCDCQHRTFVNGLELINVHDPALCEGRSCPVHHPSEHHMITWPQNWRNDRKMMERLCSHGIGHPDPDDLGADLVHGCDDCCAEKLAWS